jgi:hypothetical protein
LDADDDLLLAAASTPPLESPSSVSEDYIAAVLLRWFLDVADFVRGRASNRVKNLLSVPQIPLDLIVGLFDDENQPRSRIREALLNHVATLPIPRHLDLINTPFFQMPSGHVYGASMFNAGRWASFVRSRNIKGGTVGRRYGSIWEEFITHTLKDYGWSLIRTGVKIKKDGATLTDVDILAIKDDLLLILQTKSVIGEGMDPYDHWRNRRTIEEGAEQASLAATYIKQNAAFLERVFSKRITSTIRHIQPAVLTNVHTFNGWKTKGIPVLSTEGLMTLLRGAQVTYSDAHGFVKGAESFAKGNTLTSEEFLSLMQSPVEWHISKENIRLEHVPSNNEGVNLLIPSVLGGFGLLGRAIAPDKNQL